MSEQTDAPQGGTEGVDAPEAVDTNPEATTGQLEAGADSPDTADDAGDEPPVKKVPWFQKRIDELTAQKYAEKEQAAYWRGKAENAPAQEPVKQPEPLKRPSLEQFDYDDAAYGAAMDQYVEKRAEQAAERVLEQRESAQSQKSQIETAQSRLAQGAEKHSDFTAVTENIPLTPAIRDLLVSDEAAPDVLYELAKNGDVAAFARLTPYMQAVELGKIAGRLSPPKPTQRTIAPPPPQTVAGLSAGMTKAPEQMSPVEYNAWREAGGGK